MLNRLDLILKS